MTNKTTYTRRPYRGYYLMTDDSSGRTQIWLQEDCICTELDVTSATRVVDHWIEGASR